MGAYAPAGFCNKNHKSFFKPWCKHFYALHIAPLGKPKVEIGTEYPDLVSRGVSPRALSAKPSPVSTE